MAKVIYTVKFINFGVDCPSTYSKLLYSYHTILQLSVNFVLKQYLEPPVEYM